MRAAAVADAGYARGLMRCTAAQPHARAAAATEHAMMPHRRRRPAARAACACALPSCGQREATVKQFKLCGGCKQIVYCGAEHAKLHWREHKKACARDDKQHAAE